MYLKGDLIQHDEYTVANNRLGMIQHTSEVEF